MQDLEIQLQTVLENTFRFKSFRPGQREAIVTLMTKGKALCIQPTGHGKSLLYQLPSCLLGGITIVISPLLALIRDQITQLNNRFNISAASFNSDQTDEENYQARQAVLGGKIRVLFVAPEQLDHVDRLDFLLNLDVKLIVVDEAHCISTWGHDFRPSYRQIIQFVEALQKKNPAIKILGLTATADKRVESDISKQLAFSQNEVAVLRETMNRPNIQLSAIKVHGIPKKLAILEHLLTTLEGSGLIYCATRENCELVAEYLDRQGLMVKAYHAGLEQKEKWILQQEFLADKCKALSATNALGMGIDKGNLRFIIHFDVPGSITAYYQEVGRCGRDGNKAQGILLYDQGDRRIQEYFIDSALPKPEDFSLIQEMVGSAVAPPNLTTIKRTTGLHPTRVTVILAELIEQQFLTKSSYNGTQVYATTKRQGTPDLSRYANQFTVKTRELKNMLDYGQQSGQCRMAVLRRALGDEDVDNCGHCDNCLGNALPIDIPPQKLAEVKKWVEGRLFPIAPSLTHKISGGVSLLDGKMKLPLFINFMKNRACSSSESLGMDDELIALLKKHLTDFFHNRKIAGVVPMPSRTWCARNAVAQLISSHLHIPVIDNLIAWREPPVKRQGELLNNDQRHFNVHQKMHANPKAAIPAGCLILLDDYIGSGNTIKEAGRAIREMKTVHNEIVPFTIAAIKWHLGKPGFS